MKSIEERFHSVEDMLMDQNQQHQDTDKVSRGIFLGGEVTDTQNGEYQYHIKKSSRLLWIVLGVFVFLFPLIILVVSKLLK